MNQFAHNLISRKLATGLSVAALSLSVLCVSPVQAMPGGHHGMAGASPQKMLERIDKNLDLTQGQRAQVEGILNAGSDVREADVARLKEIREALHAQQEGFDAASARALSDEAGLIIARLTYQRVSSRAEIFQLLDEEQRTKLTTIQNAKEERRAARRNAKERKHRDK